VKVDYTLTPTEQVNMMKLMLVELSQYWKSRAVNLEKKLPNGLSPANMATVVAIELKDCARQLDKILAGEPTEADGFKL